MSEAAVAPLNLPASGKTADRGVVAFAVAALSVVVLSALLAGFVPLAFSIVTVFLFAGPHNWFEIRYFLSRMPPRWGTLRVFFLTSIVGVVTLTLAFIAIPILSRQFDWSGAAIMNASAAWNSGLILWIALLVVLRKRQKARGARLGDWQLPLGVACLLVSGVWIYPAAYDVAIVYLHPFVALWFLDREIARQRPAWQRVYRRCLLAIPVALVILWWQLVNSPPLEGNDMLTMRITRHAGAEILTGISSHALVATHTFLEMIHYGVWIVAMPLVALRTAPWNLTAAPLARRSTSWKWLVIATGIAGLFIVLALWGAFLVNYPITRDVYFTVAIGHVLAEASFLLRLL